MVSPNEFRLGNYLLQKVNNRILSARCNWSHFELMAGGRVQDLFPVVLQALYLEKCGFVENMKYPLLPAARQFILVLPVGSSGDHEVHAFVKNNKECFARLMVNNIPSSNPIYHIHQLQNLYYSMVGKEMEFSL